MEPLALLIACLTLGTLSLGSYLSFRYGADRASERWVAWVSIKTGSPNVPMVLVAGAAFWYAGALAVVTTYLGAPWRIPAVWLALTLFAVSIFLMLFWFYLPPDG